MRSNQPALFDLGPEPTSEPAPVEHVVCIVCGVLDVAVVTEEAATYKDAKHGGVPEVIQHVYCSACDSTSLVERVQESPWIRRIWNLPPKPERSWRRNSRRRSTPRRR